MCVRKGGGDRGRERGRGESKCERGIEREKKERERSANSILSIPGRFCIPPPPPPPPVSDRPCSQLTLLSV